MKKIILILSLAIFSVSSNAVLISHTGKYKVHADKCYREIIKHPQKTTEWEEFECVPYLEAADFDGQILSYLEIYSNYSLEGKVSEKAYIEIVRASMFALSQKEYLSRKVVMERLRSEIKEAQKRYPAK